LAEQIFEKAINKDNFVIPEAHHLLTTLKAKNHILSIVSFCNKKVIKQKLGCLTRLFYSVVGFEMLMEYPKPQEATALKKLIESLSLNNLVSNYITDAITDFEPANIAKINHVVAIT
jgi:hypothetical protein